MFISKSFAEEVLQQPTFSSAIGSIVPLLIFITIFYLLLIRPQQKKQKEHDEEVKNLKVGDKVITNSGVLGKVKKIKELTLIVEIASNVEIEILSENVNLIKNDK